MIIDGTLTQCYTFSNCHVYQPIYYLHIVPTRMAYILKIGDLIMFSEHKQELLLYVGKTFKFT